MILLVSMSDRRSAIRLWLRLWRSLTSVRWNRWFAPCWLVFHCAAATRWRISGHVTGHLVGHVTRHTSSLSFRSTLAGRPAGRPDADGCTLSLSLSLPLCIIYQRRWTAARNNEFILVHGPGSARTKCHYLSEFLINLCHVGLTIPFQCLRQFRISFLAFVSFPCSFLEKKTS